MREYINPKPEIWNKIIKRPQIEGRVVTDVVKRVFNAVQNEGDIAIQRFTLEFDRVSIEQLRVREVEFESAAQQISAALRDAIDVAANNIRKFHSAQRSKYEKIETTEGVECWQIDRPIEKIGIYIPGGSAPLFSTVLMLGIPAKIAGCGEIVLCSPPDEKGNINPIILYTAALIGIDKVYKVGGIQAIAALTYGTRTIPQVYKILGPGNQYVTSAKHYALSLGTAVDLPAGPSELLVLVEAKANLKFVAADLLSQAEHGVDSQVVAVLATEKDIVPLRAEIEFQLKALPRKEIAEKSLSLAVMIVLEAKKDRLDFINEYAPEHLIITGKDADGLLPDIKNAGSIFLGDYSPESAGDYASGTNHTLPTNGAARTYSGVNLDTFLKKITVQKLSKKGLVNLGPTIEIMAEAEELLAHKNAVTIRLKSIEL